VSVPETTENWNDCLCGYCPSFAGKPDFYCAKGKAEKKVEKKDCKCPECPVWIKYSLKDKYYCIIGKSK